MAKMKNTEKKSNAGEDVEKLAHSSIAGGM